MTVLAQKSKSRSVRSIDINKGGDSGLRFLPPLKNACLAGQSKRAVVILSIVCGNSRRMVTLGGNKKFWTVAFNRVVKVDETKNGSVALSVSAIRDGKSLLDPKHKDQAHFKKGEIVHTIAPTQRSQPMTIEVVSC